MDPNTSTQTWLRVALTLFGVFLSAQAAWILLAERHRLNHIRLPVDGKTATIALAEQDKIKQAASLAVVRGDLWAESAFTYGTCLRPWQINTNGQDISRACCSRCPITRHRTNSPCFRCVWTSRFMPRE